MKMRGSKNGVPIHPFPIPAGNPSRAAALPTGRMREPVYQTGRPPLLIHIMETDKA